MSEGTRAPRLVLGLGNPGQRYAGSRHNLGFEVVGEVGRRAGVRVSSLECNALVGWLDGDLLALPQTFMNRSGHSARCLSERHGFDPEDVLVVYDEVNLPLGRIRMRTHGGPGGHRGMESVVQSMRSDRVPRLRLGVAPEGELPDDLVDYVLDPFSAGERSEVKKMIERAADAVETWLRQGAEVTMNRFNG